MRLATYNVENLFCRAKVMNLSNWQEGRLTLEQFAEACSLLGEATYTPALEERLAALLTALGLGKSDEGPYVELQRNRGSLLQRKDGAITVTAQGRADWVGDLRLRSAPVQVEAVRNTARVIAAVRADVLAVVEAESRPALLQFRDDVLHPLAGTLRYPQCMLIDGNDPRGIDVGLLLAPGYTLGPMYSHVNDLDGRGRPLFSRDCPEYSVSTPGGQRLLVLINHLKSKGYGTPAASNARRKAQATRVAAIYQGLRAAGETLIAVVGDFNDTPTSASLQPLLGGTDLQDAFAHPAFDNGGFAGTFGSSSALNKLDYLLLSPALFARVQAGGVERSGVWPGARPKWPALPTLLREADAASDHAACWVDLQGF